jgi:cytidine deaminase
MEIISFSALTKEETELIKEAQRAAKKSDSDLGHQIGCLIKCKNGKNYVGATNIRTRTIGSTCAERMALDQMHFYKNTHPELCVLIGKLPETKWRRK